MPGPDGVDSSLLVIAFANQIFALDRATGNVRWEVPFGEQAAHREIELAIIDGVVIAANPFHLMFVDYASGKVRAKVELAHERKGRPTMLVDGGQVFVCGDASMSCFDMSGKHLWTNPFKDRGRGSVALGVPGNVRQADDIGTK
jgi:hypothetical protein